MSHSAHHRKEAACEPIVLADEHRRTVAGYTPAPEDLAVASGGTMDSTKKFWVRVEGPHLRALRTKHARNTTGVVGISEGCDRARGKTYFYVTLGSRCRRFCIETLGRGEAFKQALTLRAAHERKVMQANAVILAARARHDRKGGAL